MERTKKERIKKRVTCPLAFLLLTISLLLL